MPFDPVASHLPPLLACLAVTEGPVLEMGIGEYSTPVLHAFCQRRPLVSVENNEPWFEQFAALYRTLNHIFILAPDYDVVLPSLVSARWSVAFLDHSSGLRRGADALALKDSAQYIVIHDYLPGPDDPAANEVRLDWLKEKFQFHKLYDRLNPWTMVFANTEIPEI